MSWAHVALVETADVVGAVVQPDARAHREGAPDEVVTGLDARAELVPRGVALDETIDPDPGARGSEARSAHDIVIAAGETQGAVHEQVGQGGDAAVEDDPDELC